MYGFSTPSRNGKFRALRYVVTYNALVLAIYAFALTLGVLLAFRVASA